MTTTQTKAAKGYYKLLNAHCAFADSITSILDGNKGFQIISADNVSSDPLFRGCNAIYKILVMDCVACLVYEFPKSPIRFRLNRYYEVRDDETGLWNGEFYTNDK